MNLLRGSWVGLCCFLGRTQRALFIVGNPPHLTTLCTCGIEFGPVSNRLNCCLSRRPYEGRVDFQIVVYLVRAGEDLPTRQQLCMLVEQAFDVERAGIIMCMLSSWCNLALT